MMVNPSAETLTVIVLLGLKYFILEGSLNTDQLDAIAKRELDSNFTIELDVYVREKV